VHYTNKSIEVVFIVNSRSKSVLHNGVLYNITYDWTCIAESLTSVVSCLV